MNSVNSNEIPTDLIGPKEAAGTAGISVSYLNALARAVPPRVNSYRKGISSRRMYSRSEIAAQFNTVRRTGCEN